MLDCINSYRNAPGRKYAVFGFKSFLKLTDGVNRKSHTGGAVTTLKTIKNGTLTCQKVMSVRLCDLCIAGVAVGIILIGCKWLKGKKKENR
ncbi:MAG: hypothetical protein IJW19_02380 [Clostridia bacterium]|nr:hypothetical protein [Clostridia bacterium]